MVLFLSEADVTRLLFVPDTIDALEESFMHLAQGTATIQPRRRIQLKGGSFQTMMAADEGLVEGEAHETTRQRRALGVDVKILADVMVKHAVSLGPVDLGLMARETSQRGLADGLIVSGPATGQPTASFDVSVVRRAVPGGFVLVGSGVDESNIWRVLEHADGAIVGTSLKVDGIVSNPVDSGRVERLAEIFETLN